jgi:hypothetical protein
MPAGRDSTGDDPLSLPIAAHGGTKLLDDADRLVPDREASGHRILAFEDMDVSAADCGGGDADQGIERPNIRDRLLIKDDASGLDKDRNFHLGHDGVPMVCHGRA